MIEDQQALGSLLSRRKQLARTAERPDFRISILLCIVWLLSLQAYQPWRHNLRTYKPASVLEQAGLFFWHIGFNLIESGPFAVVAGLASIILLVHVFGW